jgi:hexulose-6-phosphate isomerase
MTQIVTNTPAKEFIQLASDLGYDCVELGLRHQEGFLNEESSEEEIAEVKDYADQQGIDIISTCIGGGTGNLLESNDEQERGVEEAIKALNVSAKLGAKTMLHTLGRLSPDLYYEDAYNNAIDSLKQIAPHAKDSGCILAIEFVWNGFLFSPLEMRNLIDTVQSDSIGFYFDPGNMAVFHYPQHWVRALGHRIKMVHLKDWRGGPLDGGWPKLLEGKVDFDIVLNELKKVDYDLIFIHEVDAGTDSFDSSLDRMKQIVKQWQ